MQNGVRFAIAPSDGTPIYYAVTEPARGPAGPSFPAVPDDAHAMAPSLVLCDGIGCDGFIWKYLRRDLGDGHRMVHWNYRGHGRTPPPRDPRRIGIADVVEDLGAVLADSGTERAVVFGHSMGVQIALEAYRRLRGRVVGLVLLCGASGHPLRTFKGSNRLERWLPTMRFALARAPGLTNRIWHALLPTGLAHRIATRTEINGELILREDFMPYLEGLCRVDLGLFTAMLAEAGRHSADELLPTIDVPVLIVAGERDGFTPARRSRAMHQAIPGAELLMLADGTHTAPLERPDAVTRAVSAFLDRVYGSIPPPGTTT
jgi:pimeloyl-ACP methyl ester carboxylesterase